MTDFDPINGHRESTCQVVFIPEKNKWFTGFKANGRIVTDYSISRARRFYVPRGSYMTITVANYYEYLLAEFVKRRLTAVVHVLDVSHSYPLKLSLIENRVRDWDGREKFIKKALTVK